MMARADNGLQNLGRDYPEWKPWLAVVEQVLREAADPKWEPLVPERTAPQQRKVPLLAGLTIVLDPGVVGRWTQRLIRAAYQSGAPRTATLDSVKRARLSDAVLFEASLCQNSERLKAIAGDAGVDPDALQAVAALLPVPFLQACNRRSRSAIPESWMEGYCPVCGSWPALAEVRGIERSRYLRCGRCGSEWQAHCLFCPYCGMTDHNELESLVPEGAGATRVIEACRRCLGYLKTFTTLQGSAPEQVLIDDLRSVELDIAALDQGYKKPAGPGYSLDVTLAQRQPRGWRLFS